MTTLTKDPNEGLLKALLCPYCDEYMLPPIYFCENGHNICKCCRPEQSRCSDCKQPFLRARNWALENVCKQLEFPCIYRKSGCLQVFPLLELQHHQSECLYSPYNCPIFLPGRRRCSWKGPLFHMKDHVHEFHANEIWQVNEDINKLVIVGPSGLNNNMIFIEEDMFYVQFRGDNGYIYVFVKHIGPERNTIKYKNVITFYSQDEDEFLAGSYKTCGYKDDNEDIIKEGKCLKLQYNILCNFLDKDKILKTKIKITKEKS